MYRPRNNTSVSDGPTRRRWLNLREVHARCPSAGSGPPWWRSGHESRGSLAVGPERGRTGSARIGASASNSASPSAHAPSAATDAADLAGQPELAHLPHQPRSGHLGRSPVRGPDPDFPDPLRPLPDQPRPPPFAPFRRDRPPDRRLDLAPYPHGYNVRPDADQATYPAGRTRLPSSSMAKPGLWATSQGWPSTSRNTPA